MAEKTGKKLAACLVAVIAVAAAAGLFLLLRGGGSAPAPSAPSVSRADDPEYAAELKDMRGVQKRLAKERAALGRQMETVRAKANAELGGKATDEEILAELENNPEKYPEWKGLGKTLAALEARIKAETKKNVRAVRDRIAREAADGRAAGTEAGK